jgi:hypothetical protein
MIFDDVYRIDGQYPDPYQVEERLKTAPNELELEKMIAEVKEAGLDTHPLLQKFFVES